MANTPRNYASLASLIVANGIGALTAQNIADFLISAALGFVPTGTQTLSSGTQIDATGDPVIPITGGILARTLSSTPTISTPAYDGQHVKIVNVGTTTITFQDANTLAGSGLHLSAGTVAVQGGGTIEFVYLAATGWVECGVLNVVQSSIASFTTGLASIIEISGSGNNTPTYTLSYVGTPTAAVINVAGCPSPPADFTMGAPYTGPTVGTAYSKPTSTPIVTVTFTATAVVGGVVRTKTATVQYMNTVRYGVNAATSLSGAQLTALSNNLQNVTTLSTSLSPSAQYVYYAIPTRLGASLVGTSFQFGALPGGFALVQSAFSWANPSGYTENYDIWRSNLLQTVSGQAFTVA